MASLNNLVRTQNYRRLAAQLETKTSQLMELERELANAKTASTAATEKATAYNILADSLGIVNKIHQMNALSEPIEQDAKPEQVLFDNKMQQKVLQIKSVTLTPNVNDETKFSVSAELANEEKIFDGEGKELCTFKTLNLGVVTISGSEEYKYGDLKEIATFTSVNENYFVDTVDGETHTREQDHPELFGIVQPALVKMPTSGTPSLGEPGVDEIEAFITTTSLFINEEADGWRWFIKLQLPRREGDQYQDDDNDLTLVPIPAELEQE